MTGGWRRRYGRVLESENSPAAIRFVHHTYDDSQPRRQRLALRAECATQLEHRVNDRQLGPGYADYDLLAREAAVLENGRVSLAEDFFDRRPTPKPLPKHIHEISVLGKQ